MGRRMTKIRLKYIQEYEINGTIYRYFRRKGCPRIALPGLPGSREFNEAYQAALNEKPLPPTHGTAGTMARLIMDYYRSSDFSNLAPSSRKNYRAILDKISKEHGHRLVREMGRENARKIIEKIGATRPGMANLVRAVLKRVMRFAIETGLRNDNPVAGITPYKIGTHHTWTNEQLAQYEKRWPIGTQERLAYDSLLYSGQRAGDVVRMQRPSPKATTMRVVQQKTGAELVLPIHPNWRKSINAAPARGLALIANSKGQPIKRPMLTLRIKTAADKAGLPPECTAHGLRKALMRRLAEAGSTSKQIAAVSGHKSLKEIERYTAAAEQARLAEAAMAAVSKGQQFRHFRPKK